VTLYSALALFNYGTLIQNWRFYITLHYIKLMLSGSYSSSYVPGLNMMRSNERLLPAPHLLTTSIRKLHCIDRLYNIHVRTCLFCHNSRALCIPDADRKKKLKFQWNSWKLAAELPVYFAMHSQNDMCCQRKSRLCYD